MMGRNLKGQDILPYQSMIGEMRSVFHKVHVNAKKGDAHVDQSGEVTIADVLYHKDSAEIAVKWSL
jgi:hypothetical protein